MNSSRKVKVINPVQTATETVSEAAISKKRVAAYARVSTEQDEQQNSYEAQISHYTHFIKSNPEWEFVSIFADEGISGTNTKNREGFNEMVNAALNGEIDLILTKSISRFARNTVDSLTTVRLLKSAGVEVYFEKENLHTFDAKCEMMLTILSSLAQEESRSISENVIWGKQKSMRDGNVSLPYSHFLGYQKGPDGRPEIVEEEAEIVREIYAMYLDGMTINRIATTLTSRGIPTPAGKKRWCDTTIRSILTNEKYKGDALLQKSYTVDFLTKEKKINKGERTQYLVENSHEAIIDPATFNLVQEKMAERKPYAHKISNTSVFSNKLVCGDCGEFYGRKTWHGKDYEEYYRVWYCNDKYNGEKCLTPALREDTILEAFQDALDKREDKPRVASKKLWKELVDRVVVHTDRRMVFRFKDGIVSEATAPK